MNTLRWIFFIPIALLVVSFMPPIFNNFLHWVIPIKLFSYVIWCISGVLVGVLFMEIGLSIAPVNNQTVKWVLIIVLLLFTMISFMGTYLSNDDYSGAGASSINGRTGNLIQAASAFVVGISYMFSRESPRWLNRIYQRLS